MDFDIYLAKIVIFQAKVFVLEKKSQLNCVNIYLVLFIFNIEKKNYVYI